MRSHRERPTSENVMVSGSHHRGCKSNLCLQQSHREMSGPVVKPVVLQENGEPSGIRGTRKLQSRQIDGRILEGSIELVNEVGPDQFTLAELARKTSLTTGAFYRRYDSSDDILNDVWKVCWPFLRDFAESSYVGHSSSKAELETTVSSFVKPSPNARAAALILSASRRVPLIGQRVREDVESYCSPQLSDDPVEAGLRFASLSLVLGRCLLSEIVAIDVAAIEETARLMIGTPRIEVPVEVNVSPIAFVLESEGMDSDLLDAGISLISRVGFEGTTAARLARESERPFSRLEKEFGSKSDLMERLIESLVPPVLDFQNLLRDAQGIEESAVAIASWNAEENTTVRRLVSEIILVANARVRIGRIVSDNLEARARVLAELGIEEVALVRGAWHLGDAYFVGMSALGLAVTTTDMDFSGAVSALTLMREKSMEAAIAGVQDSSDLGQFL